MQTSSKVLVGAIVVAVIGFFVYWLGNSNSAPKDIDMDNDSTGNEGNSAPLETTNPNAATTTTTSASGFKDGTYSATPTYMSPGGGDSLGVTVTIKNNTVTAVSVNSMANDGTSKMYQNRFIGGIQAAVVGKSIANLKIGVVSGASLASGAFNNALTQIRAQAAN